jgi:hypothetical protein
VTEEKKHLMTLIVGKDVAERVRRAVRETPARHTLSEVAGVAMERSARVMEYLYHSRKPFPRRRSKLKVGPPPGSGGPGARRIPKARMTVYVDPEVAERFRNAVYYSPTHETISSVISLALGHAAKVLERKGKIAERSGAAAQS